MPHFCSNCGSRMEDGVRFCSNCGAQDTYQIKVEDEGTFEEPQSTYETPQLTLDETFGEAPSYPKMETPPGEPEIPELKLDDSPIIPHNAPPQAEPVQEQNTYTAPPYSQQIDAAGQQNTYQTPPYTQQQPQMNANGKPPGYGLSIASLIFGLLGGWLGLIFGIIALAKNKVLKDKGVQVRSILGIVFWAIWFIILLVK